MNFPNSGLLLVTASNGKISGEPLLLKWSLCVIKRFASFLWGETKSEQFAFLPLRANAAFQIPWKAFWLEVYPKQRSHFKCRMGTSELFVFKTALFRVWEISTLLKIHFFFFFGSKSDIWNSKQFSLTLSVCSCSADVAVMRQPSCPPSPERKRNKGRDCATTWI